MSTNELVAPVHRLRGVLPFAARLRVIACSAALVVLSSPAFAQSETDAEEPAGQAPVPAAVSAPPGGEAAPAPAEAAPAAVEATPTAAEAVPAAGQAAPGAADVVDNDAAEEAVLVDHVEPADQQIIARTRFAEEEGRHLRPKEWLIAIHGYVRMPLRFNGAADRQPFLVDDAYFDSGFVYTRLPETEWAELFVSASKGNSRVVLGLFADTFFDWAKPSQVQGVISTAFVDHVQPVGEDLELDTRIGMFWDRYGYLPDYDTYLFARTHIAGARVKAKFFDRYYAAVGFGASAEEISASQGFSPLAWFVAGVDLGWLDAAAYSFQNWTNDTERTEVSIEDGSMEMYGADVRVAIPKTGSAHLGFAYLDAERALNLAPAWEALHAQGGRSFTNSYFGRGSDEGTGSIFAASFALGWDVWRLHDMLAGLNVRFFGMLADVDSLQKDTDPLQNRDRTYVKWGLEPFYRPPSMPWLWGSVRYDRVIIDRDRNSMSFRAITPRLGVTLQDGLDVFVSYGAYSYGSNVQLRSGQVAGESNRTEPDDSYFKIQAQAFF